MDEDLQGLTIQDSLDSMDGYNDEADAWLEQASLAQEEESFKSELYGAATISTLQLGRIGHVEPRIQAGIKAVLLSQSVNGIHPIDAAAAREVFGNLIEGSVVDFANQIKFDESTNTPNRKQDLRTVLSMLQNTSGEYLDRGPGARLSNNITNEDKQSKADDDLYEATAIIKNIANHYLDPRTIGSSIEGVRRVALEESITKRLIDGTFYEGSDNLLPLPNETGVTGIVITQGIFGSPQGTNEDRLSSSGKFDDKYITEIDGVKTRFKRNDKGHKVFKNNVSREEQSEILRRTPSIQNSLFPAPRLRGNKTYSIEELEVSKRNRKFNYQQLLADAERARKILRTQMPTNRDESRGQARRSGWDSPTTEQADLQNLRNEAAILDLDWYASTDSTGLSQKQILMYGGKGSDRGGKHGKSKLSEVDLYLEKATEKETISGDKIKQGTQGWLNQRKGKITASTAANLLMEGGVEIRALELAKERLGTGTVFTGNAHTREGNEGEAKASKAFMSSIGRNLDLEEAYFETNEKFPGFGVSPDGRLYNKEGGSEGLLELKYLSSGSMEGALKKYTPQMQMQMAVTGESQTHFYALDKYTGDYVHELVKADPNMQERLIEAGQSALDMSANLTNLGVQELRNKIESRKPRQRRGVSGKETGQTKAFSITEDTEEPMTAFQMSIMLGIDKSTGSKGDAEDTAIARKLVRLDQAERMKNVTANGSDIKSLNVIQKQETKQRREQAAAKNAFIAGNSRPAFGDATDNTNTEMSDYYKKAQKDAADASKEASESIKNFGRSVAKATEVLGELGGLVTGGNASGMSEVRLAAETGQTTGQVRGTREALELGGLDGGGANRTIMAASNLSKTFNDEQQAAAKFTTLMQDRGKSNIDSVRNMNIPSIQSLQSMSPAQLTSTVAGLMQGKSPEAKAQIGKMFNMTELATYNLDPSMLTVKDNAIDENNLRDTYTGIIKIDQSVREAKEGVGSLGETAGMFGSGSQVIAGVASSATVGFLASKAKPLLDLAKQTSPKVASMLKSASMQTSSKVVSMAKSASNVAKLSPVALAASIAPMAIRAAGGIDDDGGFGDSVLDIAEFASYGAAIGSVVPVLGTAVGAAVGAGVGVANEAWEYFSSDAVPNTNIGSITSPTSQNSNANSQNVTVTVTNEISKDLIRTTTDVNGDLNIDEETGLGTGG